VTDEARSSYLRRAGRGRLEDGRVVTWSVAEGARGRRWRWTLASADGDLVHVGLIELAPTGRFTRLELETGSGMLTLHPTPEGTMAHGNVVRGEGVDPIVMPWSDGAAIAFRDDPFGSALGSGQGSGWVVGGDLRLTSSSDSAADMPAPLDVDARGVPRLADAAEWALET